jgi:hypothetical protein
MFTSVGSGDDRTAGRFCQTKRRRPGRAGRASRCGRRALRCGAPRKRPETGRPAEARRTPVTSADEAEALAAQIQASRPDGVVIVVLKKDSQPHADLVLAAAEKLRSPMVPVMLLVADPDVPVRRLSPAGLVRPPRAGGTGRCRVRFADDQRRQAAPPDAPCWGSTTARERGDGAVFRRQVADRSLRTLRGRVRRRAHRRRGSATDRPVHQRCERAAGHHGTVAWRTRPGRICAQEDPGRRARRTG